MTSRGQQVNSFGLSYPIVYPGRLLKDVHLPLLLLSHGFLLRHEAKFGLLNQQSRQVAQLSVHSLDLFCLLRCILFVCLVLNDPDEVLGVSLGFDKVYELVPCFLNWVRRSRFSQNLTNR